VSVQTLGTSSTVKPGGTVQFAIFVWLTNGNGGTATVGVAASPTSVKPTFSVCQPTGGATCSVSGLKGGNHVETQAELTAATALAGKAITLTVTATSQQASNTATATDKITVDSTSPTPTPTHTPGSGNGGNLPPPSVPGITNPGVGVSNPNPAGNLGSDFPQVSPSPNVAPTTSDSAHQHPVEVTDLSAGLPLDVRLIGGQIVGLAILAAAITIAVARLSLRRQPARHSDDGSGSS
jgi:hypothetical protein